MEKLNFIMTSDDVGRDSVENFNRFIAFLDEYKIKCTFFAVPKPRDNIPLIENYGWINALKKAVQNGHDVQLHGYTHEKFECGFPGDLVLEMHEKRAREELIKEINEEKLEIEKNLELDKLTERFSKSKAEFEKIFGYSPVCFRSTLLGTHKNFYEALSKAGIKYNSNLVVNPTGWGHIVGERTGKNKWSGDFSPTLTNVERDIIEMPISSEYTWFLTDEQIEPALKIMKDDAHKISKIENSFMMPLSHFYAVVKNPAGMEAYRRFFEYATKNFDFKSYTVKEYIKEISG
ncbi:MAG: DUF2334 domain-containing protein [Nanoarchaeota archaeon]